FGCTIDLVVSEPGAFLCSLLLGELTPPKNPAPNANSRVDLPVPNSHRQVYPLFLFWSFVEPAWSPTALRPLTTTQSRRGACGSTTDTIGGGSNAFAADSGHLHRLGDNSQSRASARLLAMVEGNSSLFLNWLKALAKETLAAVLTVVGIASNVVTFFLPGL